MARRKKTISSYKPRVHYTDEELLDAEIADLETDLRCAYRDNHPEYAEKVKRELEAKLALRGDRPSTLKPYDPYEGLSSERMIAWRVNKRDGAPWYVTHLPGEDGVDWGYGAYAKAKPLTTEQQMKFRDDMAAVGDEARFSPVLAGGKRRHAPKSTLGSLVREVGRMARR